MLVACPVELFEAEAHLLQPEAVAAGGVDANVIALSEGTLAGLGRYDRGVLVDRVEGEGDRNLEDCQTEFFADTAMAVRKVREDRDPLQAAIASEDAGRRYGLKVLRRNLADRRENFTRFLIVAKHPLRVDAKTPCKTSLIMATTHKEGSLLRALDVFHRHRLNMTKLESRPKPGTPFHYLFYVDFEGNPARPEVAGALRELKRHTKLLKVLGSYPIRTARQER